MTINWTTIATGLEQVLTAVSTLAPAAGVAGPEAALIGGLVGNVAGFAEKALATATAAEGVISDTDLASIEKSAASLQALNDQLAKTIEES